MARPQTDLEAERQLLLETVDVLVRERGAIDISMTELATRAGMSPPGGVDSNSSTSSPNRRRASESAARMDGPVTVFSVMAVAD